MRRMSSVWVTSPFTPQEHTMTEDVRDDTTGGEWRPDPSGRHLLPPSHLHASLPPPRAGRDGKRERGREKDEEEEVEDLGLNLDP